VPAELRRSKQFGGAVMANPLTNSDRSRGIAGPGVQYRWPAAALWRDTDPAIRKITINDVWTSLAQGIDDFREMPTHVFFICVIYPVAGLILFRLMFHYEMLPLLYPLVAGLALLGPFVAIGLYELSRRREQGLDTSPLRAFDVIHRPSFPRICVLGIMLAALFVLWLYVANLIYVQIFGSDARSPAAFVEQVTSTAKGTQLIVVGNVVGFLFAALVLVTSVASFPMLVDRNVSIATALRTSVRAAVENPIPIALWGVIVALALLIGAAPLLVGLAIVLPILGHATWHLYRKLVVPESEDVT
jgi:uncharacterized membrane protein